MTTNIMGAELPAAKVKGRHLVAVGDEIEHVLGYLVFYSLPDGYIDHGGLCEAWTAAGLSKGLLPRVPSDEGVFQRACRSVETRRAGAERQVEIKTAEVARSEREIVHQVNFLVRLPGMRVIEHPKALRLTFRRKERTIGALALESETIEDTDGRRIALPDPIEIARRVREHYWENEGRLHTDTLRRMVREELRRASAQAVRESGGVWFVPRAKRSIVVGLGEVLPTVCKKGAEWHRIPLADDREQREMVRRHLVANCDRVMERQIAKARAIIASGRSLSDSDLAAITAEQRRVRQIASEYKTLLADELAEVESGLTVLQGQLQRLLFG